LHVNYKRHIYYMDVNETEQISMYINMYNTLYCLFIYLLVILGFDLKTLSLQGRCSIT
jgi:FtsH-binding integral membrane protein